MAPKLSVLYIGGTGVISTACVHESVAQGQAVSVLNRGTSDGSGREPLPSEVRRIHADVSDPESVRRALGNQQFDVVATFRNFVPSQVQQDIDLFRGRAGQYVFISSASAYQTPPARLPITESTPLRNPHWQYSRDKIACEDLLVAANRETGFPMTIVRPSHTYDPTLVPFDGGWTVIERMRQGKEVIVHGDGTSLWTLTHHEDFARAFVGLLGQPRTLGEAFQITSDETLPWNAIYETLAHAAGVEPRLVHVPSDAIAALDPEWGSAVLGDKAHSVMFDNSKVKAVVPGWQARIPFAKGAWEIVEWHDADKARRQVDARFDALFDALADRFRIS